MIVGRLGMPEIGGSYFTFSNENNDLIWGFLAECHRRGWLYKGHDSMPWCARCGTGISQMEMNEGYPDREDPRPDRPPAAGRSPRASSCSSGPRRRGRSPANVAAAVEPDLTTSGCARATTSSGLARARSSRPYGTVRGPRGAARARTSSGWRYRGPFDSLPAVQGGGRRRAAGLRAPGHRVEEVSEDRGHGHRPHRSGLPAPRTSSSARPRLPVIAPLNEDGHYLRLRWLSGLDAHGSSDARRGGPGAAGFYHLEPYTHRYPHCWRCGTALLFRVVDEWYISMGEVYDKPRSR